MHNTFTIKQELTLTEFISATLFYYLTGKWLKRFFVFLFILSLIGVLLGFITSPIHINSITILRIFAPVGILFLLVLLFLIFSSYTIFTKNAYLFKHVTYLFSDWGMVRHGEQSDFSEPWGESVMYKESKSFFLIYISNTDFHILQKRMFHDVSEINHFRNFIQMKCLESK